jgi:hypothetical protein
MHRQRGGVAVAPFRDAVVDPDQLRLRANQVCEQSEYQASGDREDKGECQREAGRDGRVEPGVHDGTQARVPPGGGADPASLDQRGSA